MSEDVSSVENEKLDKTESKKELFRYINRWNKELTDILERLPEYQAREEGSREFDLGEYHYLIVRYPEKLPQERFNYQPKHSGFLIHINHRGEPSNLRDIKYEYAKWSIDLNSESLEDLYGLTPEEIENLYFPSVHYNASDGFGDSHRTSRSHKGNVMGYNDKFGVREIERVIERLRQAIPAIKDESSSVKPQD